MSITFLLKKRSSEDISARSSEEIAHNLNIQWKTPTVSDTNLQLMNTPFWMWFPNWSTYGLSVYHWCLDGWCDQTWIAWQYVTPHSFINEIQSIVCMLYHMNKSKTNVQPKITFHILAYGRSQILTPCHIMLFLQIHCVSIIPVWCCLYL